MTRSGLALALVAGLMLLPSVSWAGSFMATVTPGGGLRVRASGRLAAPVAAGGLVILSGAPSMAGVGPAGISSGPIYLIVDANPLDAQVFLDGRLLGTASDLVARAFPLNPGRHAIEIVAPGFRPYAAKFSVVPGSFPARFRVALTPD
ncbi:MAG: PEGA domain-containing protein [Candidatus Rokubacteria bacterium]|nr:PEGA domain-containing protein [Candidatus Rokubacteria bacterium]